MESPMATILLSGEVPTDVRLFIRMSDFYPRARAPNSFFYFGLGSFNRSIPIFNSDTDLTSGSTLGEQ